MINFSRTALVVDHSDFDKSDQYSSVLQVYQNDPMEAISDRFHWQYSNILMPIHIDQDVDRFLFKYPMLFFIAFKCSCMITFGIINTIDTIITLRKN
jgi:hypothetical protein